MKKKRGLGRGLDALLNDSSEIGNQPQNSGSEMDGVSALPLDMIRRGRFQPRRDFNPDSMQELSDSILAQGVVQPIVVRPVENGQYEIIAGERRWRASQQAGLSEIPVVVKEVTDQTAMAMGLIENIQREDLNPLEEANSLFRLLNEFELTHHQIAQAVGRSRTSVTNLLRLLDLNPDVKKYIEERRLEMGHARALLGLKEQAQSHAAHQVVSKGLSVRETERLVRRLQGDSQDDREKPAKVQQENPDIRRLENDLTDKLGARVKLQQNSSGKGKLVISYNTLDEFRRHPGSHLNSC